MGDSRYPAALPVVLADLSIFQHYPIGTVAVWRADRRDRFERQSRMDCSRYSCDLVLTKRQSAAVIVRGIWVASSLMIRYGVSGLLELFPERHSLFNSTCFRRQQ